jgi:hypothetical protein
MQDDRIQNTTRPRKIRWALALACGFLSTAGGPVIAQGNSRPVTLAEGGYTPPAPARSIAPPRVALEELPADVQARVRPVMEKPTLSSHGPVEAFTCQPGTYYWLLEHPDLATRLWRSLGAQVADISPRRAGVFAWQDEHGSELLWETIYRTATCRILFAEGKVRANILLPSAPVRAVLMIHHQEEALQRGKPGICHQMDLIVQTDSQAAALAARLLGPSAPHMAEQFVSQIEMFYGALAWYLDQYPDQAASLMADLQRPAAPAHPSKPSRFGSKGALPQ